MPEDPIITEARMIFFLDGRHEGEEFQWQFVIAQTQASEELFAIALPSGDTDETSRAIRIYAAGSCAIYPSRAKKSEPHWILEE